MNNLVTEYPLWAIVLCPLIGLVFALLLYYKNKKSAVFSSGLNIFLAIIRFIVISAICLLILEPFIRYFDIEIEPPILVLATDNSSSMVMGPDSVANRVQIESVLGELNAGLQTDFDVAEYTFGQSVRTGIDTSFSDAVTDFSDLFSSISARYSNRNLGAVILVSDGIYNRGKNPRYAVSQVQAPVYTVGVGDTTQRKDALIAEVVANRIAFLGNKFPIEAVVRAKRYPGKTISYSIEKEGKTLETGDLNIEGDQFETTIRFLLDAEAVGLHRYTIRIGDMGDEVTLANNSRSVFVDVIDSRQKIRIVARSPHPDIAALRNAISSNDNYEVEVVFEKDFNSSLAPADLLILHQFPSKETTNEAMAGITDGTVPFLTIVGLDTDLNKLSKMGVGAKLNSVSKNWNDVGALVNKDFALFKHDESLIELLRDVPPVLMPFGNWSLTNAAEVMLFQRVGQISTADPLLVFNTTPNQKSAVLLGEGIWRWRLYNYATSENHAAFDGFVGSVVQYLSLKEDKRLFRVFGPTEVMENERLMFNAELYNKAFQPINDDEASLSISDEDGNEFPFTFSRTPIGYKLDAGVLPVGNYTFSARVVRNGEVLIESGSFIVQPFALEGASLTANHQMLYNISQQSGGELYNAADIDALIAEISNSNQVQPKSFSTEVLSSILNFKWIFFVLFALLSIEWIARKRAGHY